MVFLPAINDNVGSCIVNVDYELSDALEVLRFIHFLIYAPLILSYLQRLSYLIFRSATPGESSHSYEVTLARRVLYSRLPCPCLIHLLPR